jgi:hypothetical protein
VFRHSGNFTFTSLHNFKFFVYIAPSYSGPTLAVSITSIVDMELSRGMECYYDYVKSATRFLCVNLGFPSLVFRLM